MLTLSNPRESAIVDDWPHGRRRVTATFTIESKTISGQEKFRCSRVTTGGTFKPKRTTYYLKMKIVDGDDGRIYLIGLTEYGQRVLIPGTLKTTEYFYSNEGTHSAEHIAMSYHIAALLG